MGGNGAWGDASACARGRVRCRVRPRVRVRARDRPRGRAPARARVRARAPARAPGRDRGHDPRPDDLAAVPPTRVRDRDRDAQDGRSSQAWSSPGAEQAPAPARQGRVPVSVPVRAEPEWGGTAPVRAARGAVEPRPGSRQARLPEPERNGGSSPLREQVGGAQAATAGEHGRPWSAMLRAPARAVEPWAAHCAPRAAAT